MYNEVLSAPDRIKIKIYVQHVQHVSSTYTYAYRSESSSMSKFRFTGLRMVLHESKKTINRCVCNVSALCRLVSSPQPSSCSFRRHRIRSTFVRLENFASGAWKSECTNTGIDRRSIFLFFYFFIFYFFFIHECYICTRIYIKNADL